MWYNLTNKMHHQLHLKSVLMLGWSISMYDSNGNHKENPRYLRSSEKDIKRV
ncbi:hypothetical protein [Nostoc commune]|uniref:hypothetical protein n=1 Tax=Nostoc commune TaxID=1178 RepID=UPI001C6332A3|nr:hypothetical protein [Nostoc commune]